MTLAMVKTHCFWLRWAGHGVLVLSLLLGMLFSPMTRASADDNQLIFFFLVGKPSSHALILLMECCVLFLPFITVGVPGRRGRCMLRGLVDKEVMMGNTLFLLAELLQLLYWSCYLTLPLPPLLERDTCLICPNQIALCFITLCSVLLLRMLYRRYAPLLILKGDVFAFSAVCGVIHFVSAASALADVHVVKVRGSVMTQLVNDAFCNLFRQTLTGGGGLPKRTKKNMGTIQLHAAGREHASVQPDGTRRVD
ncbi:hypothetical protein TraAM80_04156 [Trypanosoma rangeli]|uniref:Transmembrane protein n=1 Tax=Trypanosoma rangeli TaxID=5698 RepID=A0A422NKQ0_TRYRA|nr:uncharacterized protein TraAM80_04156 [Trypanosoma rangeli]RNF06072.1 hypothetical protein TraAM80_04156 [Trypanosoma rangeli]|eukprot:RNF06072.1 hypothetical protein TraAM80_04156 [Trypanosoma rangeli]